MSYTRPMTRRYGWAGICDVCPEDIVVCLRCHAYLHESEKYGHYAGPECDAYIEMQKEGWR